MYKGKGKIIRAKSVDYLIREIQQVARDYPLTFIRFLDDVFGPNPEWLAEFAERFPREIGVPFSCYVRPNMVTADYCQLLKRAGCYSVLTAIECGDEDMRTTLLNRKMTDEQILTACAHLREAGIKIYSLNMVGLPGETREHMLKTISLNRQAKVDFGAMNLLWANRISRSGSGSESRSSSRLPMGLVRISPLGSLKEKFATSYIASVPK